MGPIRIRSLLLAAFVISNCITWTASRHHFTHNVSRHRSRHRRQGAGLYLPASYVLPGGEGSGAWGEWGEVSPCSRTCGGGVASQKRICLEVTPDGRPACQGGDTKYFSCETQDCPEGSIDFRQQQCSEHNHEPLNGVRYTWVPYTKAPNPCELNCMPKGERFYFRHAKKVVDGTRCNEESFDVCVDGVCQLVGCDMMLGSNAREDNCRECRGNNTNCKTYRGTIPPETELRQGYNDLMLIPAGATSIYIAEVANSNNYLALRSRTDNKYYLNGDYHIDFPRTLLIAGALWHYERSQQGFAAPDKLRCQGPTDEPLYLSLLLQDQNVGIEYEYSLPNSVAPPPNQQYVWVHGNFTPCSMTCGGGWQTRDVSCRSRDDLQEVNASLCDEGLKPPTNQTCGTQHCAARWVEGPWSPCKPCGEGGTRSRTVHCEKIITNGYPSIVADKECFELLGPKPELYQECGKNTSCPQWYIEPWKPCDKLCGEGKQTRRVICYQKDESGRIDVLGDDACADEKPATDQPCLLHPCDGVDWVLSEWSGCDSCTSIVRSRNAVCSTKDSKVVNETFCSHHAPPVLEEPCDKSKLPACDVQWYATQWSNCSVQCGKGVQTRKVFCGLFDGAAVTKVDDTRCNAIEKYNDTKPCEIPPEKCPAKWYTGPWGECTEKCGGGSQYRKALCLMGTEPSDACDGDTYPDTSQNCNMGPCDKDETLPVDSKTTPIMDEDYDYEECDEDEYDDLGAEEETPADTSTTLMYSDSPASDEGSGFTGFTESDFTEGSGSEPTSLSTEEGSGSEPTETTETGETESTFSTESSATESTESLGSTESTVTETTESGATDESTGTSESGGTTESSATEETMSTESPGTTESGATEATELSSTTGTGDTSSTESGSTDSSTDVSGSTESGTTETGTTESGTTESGSTDETTSSGSTEPTATEETSDSSTPTETSTDSSTTTETDISSSTTESGTTESTTESGSTDETTVSGTEGSSTTESGSTDSSTDVSGSTETTESGSTGSEDTSSTESGTTESGVTEATSSTEPTESGATDETTETGTEETTESGSTETEITESTVSGETTESGATTESGPTSESEPTSESGPTETEGTTESEATGSTESTESGPTTESGATETTLEGSSTTEITGETTEESTEWSWSSTIESFTKKIRKCKRKKSKCKNSTFGCCPDKRTPAAGPFEEGCLHPTTCKESTYGCCPDGVSPATGPKDEGCPTIPCKETLYGCCKSDNKTPSGGNNQEGCPPPPPPCKASKYGCCKDGKTEATGPKKKGCPETEPKPKGCAGSKFGCCSDNKTEATGPNQEGCHCSITEFGCCPDGEAPARGPQMEGCVMSCNNSAYGCCPDGETPAHGPDYEGCCLQYPFGCCPDNYKEAEGPNMEGCGCQYGHYGCCPDNVTIARGPNKEGCGCQFTEHGCCPDRHTEASGPDYEGCGCHTYQFGCCPDGSTIAQGPNLQGCHCQYSKFGCCGDGETAATGPDQAGCDCSTSKYGCCPDGQTEAKGPKFLNCTDIPENRQAACSLPTARGPCRNYTVYWFYDMDYGGCSRFWYGGCEGNGNRFTSKEECDDVCVDPAPKDACKLPKVKGACQGYHLRWYYDTAREVCSQFVYGGCLGNGNNFESRELCQERCEPVRGDDTCKLPIERGSCAGNFGRWGFNSETGRCEQFIWGGCEGNGNRFSSEAACVMRCDPPGALKPKCLEPQEVGNCTDKVATWSFSQKENRCVPFYYTGCGGNGNRFESEQSCTEACPSAFVQDTCALPAVTGECADYREKWYYDTAAKRCRQFYYGGCGGNGNNFATERECERRCSEENQVTTTVAPRPPEPEPFTPESCFLPPDRGPCGGSEQRWAYDAARGSCVLFEYGGCTGNRNNFYSQEECHANCAQTQDICQLRPLVGPCEASMMRYFYDPATDSCSQFTYGGCAGNGNNFGSLEECEKRCRSGQTTTTTVTPVYQPESIPRECYTTPSLEECGGARGEVWYYEPAARGCVAHSNAEAGPYCRRTGAFPSEEACLRSCGAFRDLDVCRYPMDPGPCRSYIAKYYFDQATSRCEQFTYGGCHGGPNRFSSADECEQVCKPETDPCKQRMEPGNCVGYEIKWYYDQTRYSCEQFVYTGCDGNDNRFETQQECERQCGVAPAPPQPPATPMPQPPPPSVEEECRTPDSLEPCGRNVTMYYYEEATRTCQVAAIGDCRHPNSYRTEEECERRCGAFRGLDPCNTPLDPGPCRGSFPKIYWDAVTRRCQPYVYGGCNGGPNRFNNIEECEEVCGAASPDPACLQTVDTGDSDCAELAQRRWFFSQQYEDCQVFVYTGCGGNGNNFVSFEECEALCKPDLPILEPEEPDTGDNEVVPDCSAFVEECRNMACPYSVQRTRMADGCERCSCVPVEIDCTPLRQECENLKCNFGMERITRDDGCERCRCVDHPCAAKDCPPDQRCVANAYRDPITQEPKYGAECRTTNKPGQCPAESATDAPSQCRRECNDDADCRAVGKCCQVGCSLLCLEPATPTSPAPRTTTYTPELEQAPQANAATEPEVTSSEGGKATLRCLFHGNPPPKITWRRGEITIDGTVGRYRLLSDGALEIVSLYRNDSGVYICVADNGLGVAKQEIRLQVNVPVSTRILMASSTIAPGSELSIPCEVDGYPTPEVHWTKDSERLAPSDRMQLTEARLTIRNVTPDDSGTYGCHASNPYTSHYSTVQISVQGMYIPPKCTDNPFFADCKLIVRSKFCQHKYYSKFCCKSCVEAGQLDVSALDLQADEAWRQKK